MDELVKQIRDFARARDWEQFHNPKNLVMALAGEVGELSELFQWLTAEQAVGIMSGVHDPERVRHELADVMIYSLRLSDVLGIDPAEAIREKLAINEAKYPVPLARGSARKATELGAAE